MATPAGAAPARNGNELVFAGIFRAAAESAGTGPERNALERVGAFYARRDFRPVWSEGGSLTATRRGPMAHEVLDVIDGSRGEGLHPESTVDLRARLESWEGLSATGLYALDVDLTRTVLTHAEARLRGRVDPRTLGWHVPRAESDHAARVVERGIERGTLPEDLAGLSPGGPEYDGLVAALARYRSLAAAGGWSPLPAEGRPLGPGRANDRARRAALATRLVREGYLDRVTVDDATLFSAVREFQRRHGLDADGVVGRRTRAAFDVPARFRAAQIEANLERLRWLPRDLGRRHVVVNVPAFELKIVRDGRVEDSMRVIVGKPSTPTPLFSATIERLVTNPYWHVPRSIAIGEILPQVRDDPDWLTKNGYAVVHASRGTVEPVTVDWNGLTTDDFPYRFRQAPGEGNALGRLKFLLPNRFDVYLHDTPNRHLFSQPVAAFSHGCIRVERPLDLAAILLDDDRAFGHRRVRYAIDAGRHSDIPLPEPVPIYLLYRTTFVNEAGEVEFRPDIYGADERLVRALGGSSPAGVTVATSR